MPSDSTLEAPRLLFVHAHPDDESINNGATIAHYVLRGAQVNVLTCTLGEEGEVIGDQWARLAVDHADQLGGFRIAELGAALGHLGVAAPMFLGGAGRWRDSGMAGTAPNSKHERFVDADEREAVGALVAVLRDLRPHVVVTYDPNGGYGHPDHIRAHQVTTAAVAASGGADYPGEPWTVPKFYWTVSSNSAFAAALAGVESTDLLPNWRLGPYDGEIGYADDRITAVVDAHDALPAKIAALAAHATQVAVGPTGRVCALSNDLALPILGEEHYVLVAGSAGDPDSGDRETDLLAGLQFG
ncbi:MAG: N-acetyl-1-D-myo-inositol-2-amino-2-deoxy-alpha-D-glucopyranoside deacetylase [Mycobacterium sp.]